MNAAPALRAALGLAAIASVACKYDLEKLRQSDAAPLVDMTAPPIDAPDAVVTVDMTTPPVDVPRDTATPRDVPTRPPHVGTCSSHFFVDLAPTASNTFGGTIVVNGNTAVDTPMLSTLTQPVFGMGCSSASTSSSSPERVFKYTVRNGPRLVATTNGPPCSGAFDTVLYAINSCDSALSGTNVLDCNDDDVSMCMCPGSVNCEGTRSTVEIGPVQTGDVVYFVVDGYSGMGPMSGAFRLSVAENGARPVAPPETTLANHCTCPSLAAGTARVVDGFPNAALDRSTTFRNAGDMVSGRRGVALRTITGLAGQFRMGANNIAPQGSCATAKAIVDVVIEGTVAASFQLASVQEAGSMVQVMYSTFAPITVTDQTMVSLAYRLRGFDPSTCMGSFEINQANPIGVNQLTLYGTP